MPRPTALIVLALTLASPSAAAASSGPVTVDGDTLRYRDATGATRDVTAIEESATRLYLGDQVAGGPLAGPSCKRVKGDWVSCPKGGVKRVSVDLGGGSDWLGAMFLKLPLELLAGPGADVVFGGGGADVISGGAQGDVLTGANGADVLRGGDDDTGAGSGDDVLDGGLGIDAYFPGDGVDTISFASIPDGVTVTLDGRRNDGKPVLGVEEGSVYENVPDVEVLEGSGGSDELNTNDGPHEVRGGAGDDAISTGNAADWIVGGGGEEYVEAGGGDDVLLIREGWPGDSVMCEGGFDTVVADRGDDVGKDCERVLYPPQQAPVKPGPRGPSVTLGPRAARLTGSKDLPVTITCPRTVAAPCRGLITLALRKPSGGAGERIGSTDFAVTPGQTGGGGVPLNAEGRRRTSADRPVRALLIADVRTGASSERRTTAPIVLRRR